MNIKLGQKLTVKLNKGGETFTGYAWDTSSTHVYVDTGIDCYSFPMEDCTITLIEEVTQIDNEQHIKGREIKSHLNKVITSHWGELINQYVQVYEFEEDGVQGYDVEIICKYDDGDMSCTCTNSYGISKEAVKRAKQIAKMLNINFGGIYTL